MRDRGKIAQGTPGSELQLLCVAMYAEDPEILKAAAAEGLPMLTTTDLTRPGRAGSLRCVEIAYWRGVEAGLLPET